MDAKILILALLLVATVRPAAAQETLLIGQPISGTLASDQDSATFTFSASDGMIFSLLAESLDGRLDPLLELASSGGALLLSNDDYDYPDRRDALIEAFTIPRTGEYRVTLRAVNPQGGQYRVTLFSGYPTIVLSDTFDTATDVVPVATTPEAALSLMDGGLLMGVAGVDQTFVTRHPRSSSTHFYAQAQVVDIAHRGGWIVGLALRVQPDGSRYHAEFDDRGLWRFVLIRGEERTILRDWAMHPAIRAGMARFSMAALAAPGGFDVFYDGLYIGTVATTALPETGQVGFVVQSRMALDGRVEARFDNLAISAPVQVDGERVMPAGIIPGNAAYVTRQLHRAGVIPIGGAQVLDVPELTMSYNGTGISEAPLARGLSVSRLVYSGQFSITASREALAGCGLVARRVDQRYLLAYTDSAGGYGLSVREGDTFPYSLFAQFATRPAQVWLMLIADDTHAHLFVEGRYFATLPQAAYEGTIATATLNFDQGNTTCRVRSVWLWRW